MTLPDRPPLRLSLIPVPSQLQANEYTQHTVPQTDAERTGSVVFRSIKTLVEPHDARLPESIRTQPPAHSGGRRKRGEGGGSAGPPVTEAELWNDCDLARREGSE